MMKNKWSIKLFLIAFFTCLFIGTSVYAAKNSYTQQEVNGFTAITETVIKGDGTTEINIFYKRNTYAVTASKGTNVGVASVSGGGTYKYEQQVTLKATMTPGYQFDKWTSSNTAKVPNSTNASYSFNTPASAVTLTASATPISYAISYDLVGGTITGQPTGFTVESNALSIPNPTRVGYEFAGWTGSNGTTPQKSISIAKGSIGNKSYTANWTPITYSIGYTLNGGTLTNQPTSYTIETATFTLPSPTKTGYTFMGWSGSNGTTPSKNVSITIGSIGNKSYTANWQANTNTVYKVEHYQMKLDGTTYDLFETDELKGTTDTSVKPDVKTYTGFTSPATQTVNVDGDGSRVVKYYYTRNQYVLSLTSDKGIESVIGADTYYYGADVTVETVVKPGYTWKNWTSSDTSLLADSNTQEYTFTMPAGNVTLTASTSINTYTISYELNGGTVTGNPSTYTVESETITLNNPTRIGYTFLGWTGSNGSTPELSVSIEKGTIGNKEYTANWEARKDTKYTVEHYRMNIGGKDYTLFETDNLEGTTDTEVTPETKVYTGFTAPEKQTVNVDPDGSRVVKYYYTRNQYTLSVKTGTGVASVSGAATYYFEENVEVNSVMKAGYTWSKWTSSNTTLLPDSTSQNYSFTMPAGDVELTANATAKTDTPYKVEHYKMNLDGTTYDLFETDELKGTTDTNVTPDVKEYIGFTSPETQTVNIDGDGTRVVKYYYSRNQYELNLISGIGINSVTGDGTYYYGADITVETVVKPGYTWKNWASSDTSLLADSDTQEYTFTMPAGDVTLTANTSTNVYTISYELNGGTVTGNPSTYTVESETIILNAPIRKGYTFIGWTGSNGDTPQLNVSIEKGSLGNKAYTANWKANTYLVEFDSKEGNFVSPIEVIYDSQYGELDTPYKEGYTFLGWFLEETFENEVKSDTIVKVADDHTLYAKWSADDFTIISNPTMQNGTLEFNKDKAIIGETITVNVLPNEGWTLVEGSLLWSKEGEDTKYPVEEFEFIMPASNVIVYAEFEKIPYELHVNSTVDPNEGKLDFNKDIAYIGDEIDVAFENAPGYALVLGSLEYKKLPKISLLSEIDEEWIPIHEFSFIMPASDVEVRGKFMTESKLDIPDHDLRCKIVEEILDYRQDPETGKWYDPYGNDVTECYIYDSEKEFLDRVTDLDLSDSGIKDLDGLENFPNLEDLDLSGNELEEADFGILPKLRKLDVSYNKLHTLILTSNSKLEILYAHHNVLPYVNFSGNPLLNVLTINNNKLTQLDMSKTAALTEYSLNEQYINYQFKYGTSHVIDFANLHKMLDTSKVGNIKSYKMDNQIPVEMKEENLFTYENGILTFNGEVPAYITYDYSVENSDIVMTVTVLLSEEAAPKPEPIFTWSNGIGSQGVRVSFVEINGETVLVEDFSRKEHENYFSFGKHNILYYQSNQLDKNKTPHYTNQVVENLPEVFADYQDTSKQQTMNTWANEQSSLLSSLLGVSEAELNNYTILLEPVVYGKFNGVPVAMTATELALYDSTQRNNELEKSGIRLPIYEGFAKTYYLDSSIYDLVVAGADVLAKKLTNQDILDNNLGVMQLKLRDIDNEIEIEGTTYNYRIDTDVYTSLTLTSPIDRTAENPMKVSFVGDDFQSTQYVEIPAGESQLVWYKWHTPSKVKKGKFSVYVDDVYMAQYTYSIKSLDNLDPPDTTANDKKPKKNWKAPKIEDLQEEDTMRWSKWESKYIEEWEWIPNIEQQVSGYKEVIGADGKISMQEVYSEVDNGHWVGKWSFFDKGTSQSLPLSEKGSGKAFKKNYSVSLETKVDLLHDPDNPTAKGNTMKSGYGVNLMVENIIKGNGEHTEIQTGVVCFPEFDYDTYWRKLDGTTSMQFKKNKYDLNEGRTHFTPIWYPNGNYAIRVRVIDVWTPAGMLNTTTTDYKVIKGNLFDDWATVSN